MERKVVGTIATEHPQEHWGFLNVQGKTVLDLGCGINSEHTPTPWYFLEDKKAKHVVGIDSNPQSYEWFKKNFVVKNFLPIMDMIDRIEKFQLYLGYYKPEIVKMDIEGSEVLMNALDVSYLESVEQIGIEYHNLSCLISCEHKLTEAGFKLEYYKFNHLDVDYQGVLHGYRLPKTLKLNKVDPFNNLDDYHTEK